MKIRYFYFSVFSFIVLSVTFFTSCATSNNNPPYISTNNVDTTSLNSDTVLVFQSDFEGYTHIVPYGTSTDDDIVGYDPNLIKSNWNDLKANDIKTVFINYAGGDTTKRSARILTDPTSLNNKVLAFNLNDYWLTTDGQEKARIQLEFHDITTGYKEFKQSVRAYLSTDFNILKTYSSVIDWCTLAEFWNNGWWGNKPYGFRISLNVHKDVGTGKDLQFELTAQDSGFVNIWSQINTNIAIPVGKWFTIEYYFKEGNKDSGRFYMAITPDGESKQIVFDIHNFTYATTDPSPDGLTDFNPLKLYTSKEIMTYMKSKGKPLTIYWDDLKLWTYKN